MSIYGIERLEPMAKSVRRIGFDTRSHDIRERFREFLEPSHGDIAYEDPNQNKRIEAKNFEEYIRSVQTNLEAELITYTGKQLDEKLYFYLNAEKAKIPLLEL